VRIAVRCAAVLVLAALAGAGCSKSSRPHVQHLTVDTLKGGDVIGLTEQQLVKRVLARLDAARFVLMDENDTPPSEVKPWRVSVAVAISEPALDEKPKGEVQAVLSLRQKGTDEAFEVRSHEERPSRSNDVEDIQRATVEALDLALASVANEAGATISLMHAKDADLLDAAKSKDAARRDAAVRVLVRRHNPAALPLLLERLKTEDPLELRRVMGLLVELGDQRAVPKIIDASRGTNDMFQREVVFAVGAIGGLEAEAYLDTVASGHDDPLVRASARQALEELKARAPKKPSGGTKE